MNGGRDSELVEAHADVSLADELIAKAYGRHFETLMRRGRIRRAALCQLPHFARAGAGLPGFDAAATC